ncbi:SAF domain-containing protein [Paenibacillus sp. 481]|uniref:SAF domain-containing protein n=1 Tax=Paenibacillus sp. 481 TaxID=2835869 RepID=UPI001E2A7D6B|nr:SAF domain-containing protein [Paenibacillus sp. 481]UHA73103.1 SAF domain-containing protein [Paenibacillus sp. 481]
MRWTRRKKQLAWSAASGALAVGLLFGGYIYFVESRMVVQRDAIKDQYESEIERLQRLADEQKKRKASVWVFSDSLAAGKRISAEDVRRVDMNMDNVPKVRLQHENEIVGKVLKIDVSSQTAIIPTMLYDEVKLRDDTRWIETNVIQLPLALSTQDRIDVRIRFQNGQDYVVLSHKAIQRLVLPTLWMHLDEQELLTISSACVDAYVNGGQLYAVRYVEPHMQKKAPVNYPPNAAVQKLISEQPHIVKRASAALSTFARERLERQWVEERKKDAVQGNSAGSTIYSSSYPQSNGTNSSHTNTASHTSTNTGNGEQPATHDTARYGPAGYSYSPFTGLGPESSRTAPFVGQKQFPSADQKQDQQKEQQKEQPADSKLDPKRNQNDDKGANHHVEGQQVPQDSQRNASSQTEMQRNGVEGVR